MGAERPLVDLPRGASFSWLPHVDVLLAVSTHEATCGQVDFKVNNSTHKHNAVLYLSGLLYSHSITVLNGMERQTEITNDTIKVESLIFTEYICLCCHSTVNQLDCPD